MAIRPRQALYALLRVLAEQRQVEDIDGDEKSTFEALGISTLNARSAILATILLLGIREDRDVSDLNESFITDLIADGPSLGEVSEELAKAMETRSRPLPAAGQTAPRRVAAPPSLAAAPPPPAHVLKAVLYATDRKPVSNARLGLMFSGERANTLHYGECQVSIPRDRKIGGLPQPLLPLQLIASKRRHFLVDSLTPWSRQDFSMRVRDALQSRNSRDLFVFVHGFRTTFKSAVLRTAQLGADLELAGSPILYSWAARGGIDDYLHDGESVRDSADRFQAFLSDLANESGAEQINILAHSMGGQAVCGALKQLGSRGLAASQTRIGYVVLAAPDVDASTYRNAAAAMTQVSTGMTLYSSPRDRALTVSRKFNKSPRVGEQLIVLPGVDTIDASAVGTDFLFGHSYFSSARLLLQDVKGVFAGQAASVRYGLERLTSAEGPYFRVKP
ncbi:MAG TPA: alpha/beta hydrolase [Caulobacteraceae bacterium]|jgi:esterase/lipase superfamily enzyme